MVSTDAQFQDRLYPFIELTDEMRDSIDLKDGSVDDWLEVLGEPTLTPLDLAPYPNWGGDSTIPPPSTSASGWPGTMAVTTFS